MDRILQILGIGELVDYQVSAEDADNSSIDFMSRGILLADYGNSASAAIRASVARPTLAANGIFSVSSVSPGWW